MHRAGLGSEHRRQDGAHQGGGLAGPHGAERDHPADLPAVDPPGVHGRVCGHRRPPVDRREPLHLLRPRGRPARHPGDRRRGRGIARAARRDRQRHRPRRRRRARNGGVADAHAAPGRDARDDAPGRPEAVGGGDGGDRERLAPARRRHPDADLSAAERRARPVVRARHRAPPRDRARRTGDRRAGRAAGRAGAGRPARHRRGPGAGARRQGAGARRARGARAPRHGAARLARRGAGRARAGRQGSRAKPRTRGARAGPRLPARGTQEGGRSAGPRPGGRGRDDRQGSPPPRRTSHRRNGPGSRERGAGTRVDVPGGVEACSPRAFTVQPSDCPPVRPGTVRQRRNGDFPHWPPRVRSRAAARQGARRRHPRRPSSSPRGPRQGDRRPAPARARGPFGRSAREALRLRAPEPGRSRRHARGVSRVSLIPDDVIEQVREAADIVGIIGEHVELKRTGSDFRAPCPFHGGTHRNFAVIPRKGMFYCFVCHAGGDVFTFFMKKLGMDYPTAVREVARRVGITIPERGPTGPDPREPLYSAVAAAADWFARQLLESPEAQVARDYLTTRHLDLETVQPLGLGYAPKGKAFLDAVKGLGVREEVLLEAGLLARREDGTLAPRFRGRLLFPIHDLRGRVVAFGGRMLGEGEPKYLNSPDTPVFHKGKLLYNLHVAKHAMRKAERAILVEGYFDVLRLSLAGIEEVVAPLGTGLTPEQAQLVKRHVTQVILLYDPDDAGLRATFRAGDELLREGLRVSVATLPPGEDPDKLVQRQGAAGLVALLEDAVDVLERKVQILERKGFFGTLPGRRRALDRLVPTIRGAKEPITRELYISRAAEAAGVRKDVLELEIVGQPARRLDADVAPLSAQPPNRLTALPASAEKALLLLLLEGDPWKSRVTEAVDPEEFEFLPYRAVFEAVADDAVLALDDTSARAYEQLTAEGLGGRDPNVMYETALNWIEARRLERQLERLDAQLPFESPERQVSLIAEKRRVFDELRKRYPRYKIAARRRGAPGT